VVFHPLKREHLVTIVAIQLRRVEALLAERGYSLEVSEAARAYLAEVGYDPDFGARPLKRAIQRGLQDPLAIKVAVRRVPAGGCDPGERGPEGLTFTPVVKGEAVVG